MVSNMIGMFSVRAKNIENYGILIHGSFAA